MANLAITYQFIADILSFETSDTELKSALSDPLFDWDQIVVEGSKHLVLPAIYCRLQQRQLLDILPTELTTYLAEITQINRNRNKALLKQIQSITQLLSAHHIEHVFLKGSALLISGYYNDIAERMVGDIDILIPKSQLYSAFELVKQNGYDKTIGYAYQTKNHRHLDRLISSNEIGAIELHGELLKKKYRKLLMGETVLNSKVYIDHIPVCNQLNLVKHQILGFQINDYGQYYNSLNMKILYDSLVMRMYKDSSLKEDLTRLKYTRSFLALGNIYFKELSFVNWNTSEKLRITSYKIQIKVRLLRVMVRLAKRTAKFVSTRVYVLFTNRNYTKHLLKKIFILNKS